MKDNVTKNSKRFKKGKNKGRKPYSSDDEIREDKYATKSEHSNDPSWYGNNDALLRDAGSYSFNNPLGNTLRVTELSQFDNSITWSNTEHLDYPISGVMTINYIPTYGGSQANLPNAVNANTPINIAARGLYSAVRADNSGAKNYDPSDLMKYLIAMDNAICYHSFLRRVYGIARTYSSVNRYWPHAFLSAMNVDFTDVIAHLADLRYYVNAMCSKINRFCVPGNMPIFLRHYFMNAGVYRDDISDKAQTYLFVPDWLYAYDETTTPSSLKPIDVVQATGTGSGNMLTFADLIDIMNLIMDPLTASEDIGIISGDLFKRYGLDGSFNLTPMDTNYEVIPQFDAVVLSQIQNLTIVGETVKTSIVEGTTVGLDDGILYQTIAAQGAPTTISLGHTLNIFKDMAEITPSDVMEATRLTCHGRVVYNSTDQRFENLVTECGSEVVRQITIWRLGNTDGKPLRIVQETSQYSGSSYAVKARAMAGFNEHPALIQATFDLTNGSIVIDGSNNAYDFDFDNYTIIGGTGLSKLHETALLSLFGVPAMGQYK